ncbi:MAG: DUF4149 domain-containing protein [Phycisphaerae bacterium]
MMRVFRMLATTAAGVWLGGMILIPFIAAITFGEMRETGVERPETIAGQVMARNFQRFDQIQLICAGILVAWQIAHLATVGRKRADWIRLIIILMATGLLVYSVGVVTPMILELQPQLTQAEGGLAAKPDFAEFHEAAVRIGKINLGLVAAIAFSLAWQPRVEMPRRDSLGVEKPHEGKGTV